MRGKIATLFVLFLLCKIVTFDENGRTAAEKSVNEWLQKETSGHVTQVTQSSCNVRRDDREQILTTLTIFAW